MLQIKQACIVYSHRNLISHQAEQLHFLLVIRTFPLAAEEHRTHEPVFNQQWDKDERIDSFTQYQSGICSRDVSGCFRDNDNASAFKEFRKEMGTLKGFDGEIVVLIFGRAEA